MVKRNHDFIVKFRIVESQVLYFWGLSFVDLLILASRIELFDTSYHAEFLDELHGGSVRAKHVG